VFLTALLLGGRGQAALPKVRDWMDDHGIEVV
jgi:hypothetical protein